MSESESSQERPAITQDELRPVVEAVRHYGDTHPGALEQLWYERSPQRVVVLIGGADVANHDTALPALVSVSDHLEIKHSPWPQGHLERIRGEITKSAQRSIRGIGLGKGVLDVRLWADQVEMAASLHHLATEVLSYSRSATSPFRTSSRARPEVSAPTANRLTGQHYQTRSPYHSKQAAVSERAPM